MSEDVNSAETSIIDRLPVVLEEERHQLAERLQTIGEAIETLERAPSLKPDAAALLARYRSSEMKISWELQLLDRKIDRLHTNPSNHDDLTAAAGDEILARVTHVGRDEGWW